MFKFCSIFLDVSKICEKRRIKYQPSVAQLKDVLLSVNWWNLIKCLLWNEVLLFTKFKQDLFVRNRVTSNTNALPSSSETIASWHVASCKNFLYVALIVRFVGAGVLPQRPGHRLLTSAAFWNLACSKQIQTLWSLVNLGILKMKHN